MPNSTASETHAVETELMMQAQIRAVAGRSDFSTKQLRALPPDVLLPTIARVVARVVRALVDSGWRPADIGQVRVRKLASLPALCLFDVLAEMTDAEARLRADPAWTAELREVTAGEPAGAPRPCLTRPGDDDRWPPGDVLEVALDLLAVVAFLPAIPRATPLHDEAAAGDTETAMLVKVRALLVKAERTEFSHEAEAFTAKAQQLMARYSIDEAMLAAGDSSAPGTALQRIWLDPPYVRAKFSLVHAVGAANRCRVLLNRALDVATVVGMNSDVRATVLLVTSLQLQATRAVSRARPDPDDPWVTSVKTYRRSFLLAFADRIGERLREATTAAESGVDRDQLLPVLADRKALVERAVADAFPVTGTLRQSGPADMSGWAAGRAAADLAHLGARTPLR